MIDSLPDLLELLRADGVVRSANARLTPLAGGVSSEIYRVDDGQESFVVKRALPKLNVAAEWFADPRRNLHEQDYLALCRGVSSRLGATIAVCQPRALLFCDGVARRRTEQFESRVAGRANRPTAGRDGRAALWG